MSHANTDYLGPEKPFSKVDLAHVQDLLEQGNGWVGFSTPYSQLLRPFYFDDEGKRETDYTLVDFGCGWGEHVILAGIGFLSGGVPKVKKAIGLSADLMDIQTAKILYGFTQENPDYFRRVMSSTDIGIHIGFCSEVVSGMKTVFSSPDLSERLRTILQEKDMDALDAFMMTHLYAKGPDKYRQRLKGADIDFMHENLFNPDLPDNYADCVLSSSVSSYITDPNNEEAMWKHILRICKKGATINAISFPYERGDRITSAPEQLVRVAHKYDVDLGVRQVRTHTADSPEKVPQQIIFRVDDKPDHIK